jgi:hypothetical protein
MQHHRNLPIADTPADICDPLSPFRTSGRPCEQPALVLG